MVLFAVIDIVGNIPIIIDLRKKVGHIQSEKASLIAGVIMVVFLFLGQSLLELIGIDVYSFAVAGSFILFFIALEMILGITLYKDDDESESITATVFPLAFPLGGAEIAAVTEPEPAWRSGNRRDDRTGTRVEERKSPR